MSIGPLADFLGIHFRHSRLWVLLDRTLAPFSLVVVFALLVLVCAACSRLLGIGIRAWGAKLVICCWTIIWAVAAEHALKQIFGRAWPDPTYTQNHLYGFRFLRASEHWSSFPSGTATIATALATAIWTIFPRVRLAAAALAMGLCVAVVAGNYHWLSDVIAGCFLGFSIGWMSALLLPQGMHGINQRSTPRGSIGGEGD